MTTRASQNGTGTAEMEFEDEWEASPGSHHYSSGPSPYSVSGEFEDEWETGTPHHFSGPSPYTQHEFEDEWEASPGSHHYSSGPSPYSSIGEFEDEWETGTPHHFSGPSPYHQGEFEDEWETGTPHHYSQNPFVQGEFEDEWEAVPGSHHYHQLYVNQEMQHPDRFFPLIAKVAGKLIPHAVRLGRNLFRQRGSQQPGRPAPAPAIGRSQQIAALFHQLGRLFAQGESYAIAQEAEMFGVNEFETEVAGHPAAHMAALTEFLAAEAAHTHSESEAEALVGAALPMSIRVMGGRIGLQRLTPALVRVNASLVLNLHRQGTPGRQLIRVVPTIQRHTLATIRAIQNTGRHVTPALASQVMAGHARRILTTPRICRHALVRNMVIRNSTVARGGARVGQSQRVGA